MIRPPPTSPLFPYPPLSRSSQPRHLRQRHAVAGGAGVPNLLVESIRRIAKGEDAVERIDRKSTRLNSSHGYISYAVFCLKKKKISAHDVEYEPHVRLGHISG